MAITTRVSVLRVFARAVPETGRVLFLQEERSTYCLVESVGWQVTALRKTVSCELTGGKRLHGLSPQANYTDQATAARRRG
jgi:hypothetical protein